MTATERRPFRSVTRSFMNGRYHMKFAEEGHFVFAISCSDETDSWAALRMWSEEYRSESAIKIHLHGKWKAEKL